MKYSFELIKLKEKIYISSNYDSITLFKDLLVNGNALDFLFIRGRIPSKSLRVTKLIRAIQATLKFAVSDSQKFE